MKTSVESRVRTDKKSMKKKSIRVLPLHRALWALIVATAQQPKKVSRIGYLSSRSQLRVGPFRGVWAGLREIGYIEGQNIAIEYRYAEGKPDRLPELAAEFVRLKVDVIVAAGGPDIVLPAKKRPRRFPSSWWALGRSCRDGLVDSLARPGGNVTGIATYQA